MSELETKKKMLSILLTEIDAKCGVEEVAQCIVDSSIRYSIPSLLELIDKKMTEKYGDIR